MKQLLQRGKHFFSAKGRHGTHSPFVYAFVEQVLRNKSKIVVKVSHGILTRGQCNHIARTVQYLKAATVYVEPFLLASIQSLLSNTNITVVSLDFKDIQRAGEYCIIGDSSEQLAQNISNGLSSAAIVYNIIVPINRKVSNHNAALLSLKEQASIKMVLETWHVMFFSNNSDFKIKQFFKLR